MLDFVLTFLDCSVIACIVAVKYRQLHVSLQLAFANPRACRLRRDNCIETKRHTLRSGNSLALSRRQSSCGVLAEGTVIVSEYMLDKHVLVVLMFCGSEIRRLCRSGAGTKVPMAAHSSRLYSLQQQAQHRESPLKCNAQLVRPIADDGTPTGAQSSADKFTRRPYFGGQVQPLCCPVASFVRLPLYSLMDYRLASLEAQGMFVGTDGKVVGFLSRSA